MSSKVFVYNQYDPVDNKAMGILEVTFGLFFDGTLNNLRNTEIRKKVKGLDDYGNPTQDEIDIYNKEAYERNIKNLWLKKTEIGDDSFANDFSNVARMKKSLDEEYATYVEGIGTEDEESDYTIGYAFGAGQTGIRMKVRKGCEKLAEKINKKKDGGESDIKTIKVHIDAYGFSRGSAAARNFLYEIQKKPYKPQLRAKNRREYESIDSFGEPIKGEWLDDKRKLPPLGHLGVALLELGFTLEELKTIKIQPRFIGVYDTVSAKNIVPLLPKITGNDVEDLQLNNLGRVKKAVHFTAQDEHRENFSLTRMSGIEKNLPGVHSDIGGSYPNGIDLVKEIENSKYLLSPILLYRLQLKLIKQHWFKPSQIKLKKPLFHSWVLRGERNIKKEYSYIPLHFMKDHAQDFIKGFIIQDVETKYSIEDDPVLVQTKNQLKNYIMEDGEEWKFISDEEVEVQKKLKARAEETLEQKEERIFKDLMKQREVKQDNTRVGIPRVNADLVEELALEREIAELTKNEENVIQLDEVVITAYTKQGLLRKLRNEYLHWSAKREGIGMDPATSRKRTEY